MRADPGASSHRAMRAAGPLALGLVAALVISAAVLGRSDDAVRARGPTSALRPAPIDAGCSRGHDPVVRVLQLNVHFGLGSSGELDVDRLAAEIETARPDLVSLNEVDQGTQRSRRTDEAGELARATGLHLVYGPNLTWQGGLFGNAILSRFPVVRSRNHPLPVNSGLESRGLLTATVRVDGRDVSFWSTHLTDGDRGRTSRIDQATAITAALRDAPYPTIVAGDLNAEPEELTVRILRQHLLDAQELGGTGDGATVPEQSPRSRFDYVLYDSSFAVVPGSTRVLPSVSDHRGVFTELALLPERCTG